MEQKPIRVGGVEVGVLCEGFSPIELSGELPDEQVDWDAQRAAYPWAWHDPQHWAWHVHAFVLRTEAGVVMVDTGLGAFPPYRPWAEHTEPGAALKAAGVDAEEVRAVVHTHLHADHAGGAVIDGLPRFPNAVHHVHPADWSFFGRADRIGGYTARGPMAELEHLGMLDLTEEDHAVVPGVRVVHAPGHTPGHRVAILEAGDDVLVLVGDLLHVPAQVERPGSRSSHDEDPEEGHRSRVRVLSSASEGGWRVAVSHFPRPFGTVNDRGWVDGR
jgi:glyoxylase-like metal-dependent hydrolase (beta-lactamase superfamily II)